MKKQSIFWIIIGLMLFSSCRDKDLDMTVLHKTLFDDAAISEITAEDAWNVTIVQDAEKSFVELEYSAFLEEYLRVVKEGPELKIGFSRYLNLPANTVKNAIVHTASVQKLDFSEAVTALLVGDFPAAMLEMELDDAVTCKGGSFGGVANLKLNDASTMVDFCFNGLFCSLELDDASVFKGFLTTSDSMSVHLEDASRLTTYGGTTPEAIVGVRDASHLNMVKTAVTNMHINVSEASEACVNVSGTLSGTVTGVSKLFYQGNPIINVDCDDLSTFEPLSTSNF